MASNKETAEVEIRLNAEQTKAQIREIEKELKALQTRQRDLKKEGYAPDPSDAIRMKELRAEREKLNKSFKESLTVIINGDVANKSLNDLEAAYKRVLKQRKAFRDGSDEFASLTASAKRIKTQIDSMNEPLKTTTSFWKGLGQEVKKFGLLAAGFLGFQFLAAQITNIISKNAKLSDALADVQRVAGLTKTEVGLLNQQLGKIDTRTGRAELLGIAVVAGKLGVAKGDIFEFTKAVDQLVVSLGDELGNADEITTQLGKILNVFKGSVTAEDLTHLGNAFVELANNGVATGGFIADFTQRVAGVAKASNLSLGATVGLAAGFEELGLRSESSATALQKLLSTIAADIPKAAKIAGQDVGKFNELFGKNPEQALIAYARGLVKNKESFSEITKGFKDAGEEGARVVQTLQAIGQSGEFLSKKITLGNESLTSSTAIMEAFQLKNETLGAKVEKLGKALYSAFSNPAVTKAIDTLVSILSKLAPETEKAVVSANRVLKANSDNITVTKKLVDEYSHLESITKKTSAEKSRMQQIAVRLKDIVGTSAVAVNKETGELTLNRAEILKNTAAKQDANMKLLLSLQERKNALNKSYKEDETRIVSSNNELDKAIKKLKEFKLTENFALLKDPNNKLDAIDIGKTFGGGQGAVDAVKAYRTALEQLKKDNATFLINQKEISDIDKEIAAFGYSENDIKVFGARLRSQAANVKAAVDAVSNGGGTTGEVGGETAAEKKKREQLAKDERKAYGDRIKNFEDYQKERLARVDYSAEYEEHKEAEKNRKLNTIDAESDGARIALLNELYNEVEGIDQNALDRQIELRTEAFAIETKGMDIQSSEYLTKLLKFNKDIEEIQTAHNEKLAQTVFRFTSLAQGYLEAYNQRQDQLADARLAKDKRNHDKSVAQYQRQLDAKEISQDEFNSRVFNADEAYRKNAYAEGKKQFERNKKASEAAVIVSTVQATMEASHATGNYYVDAALAFATAALGAVQLGNLLTSEYPEYKDGGYFLNGPSHEDGGIDVISGGKKIAEMEGGEIIGSKKFVKAFPQVARFVVDKSASLGANLAGIDSNTPIPQFNANNISSSGFKRFGKGGAFSAVGDLGHSINEALGITDNRDLLESSDNQTQVLVDCRYLLKGIYDKLDKAQDQEVIFVYSEYQKFLRQVAFIEGNTSLKN